MGALGEAWRGHQGGTVGAALNHMRWEGQEEAEGDRAERREQWSGCTNGRKSVQTEKDQHSGRLMGHGH